MVRSIIHYIILLFLLIAPGLAYAATTLDQVKARGSVNCGVSTGVAGFSLAEKDGQWHGLDADFCRAVAAAVLGDATKVKFVPLDTTQRFTGLQSGEVDLLARDTSWTLLRDTKQGMDFTVINYYDGQAFLVAKKLGVASARDLKGATVCLQPGSTSELNLTDFSRRYGLDLKPLVIESFQRFISSFLEGRCDALSTDGSGLAALRAHDLPKPDDYAILPEIISKEPLGPAVRKGDDDWRSIIEWVFYATLIAEEKGITQANVEEALKSPDPEVQRLLGVQPGYGAALKLEDRWAYNVIRQVGNYGESFQHNITERVGLPRGLNALWTQGGLHYAPPVR